MVARIFEKVHEDPFDASAVEDARCRCAIASFDLERNVGEPVAVHDASNEIIEIHVIRRCLARSGVKS